MKKIAFLIILLALAAPAAMAQKFCYFDSQAVLEKMTEYKAVQREMDDLAQRWQGELDKKYEDIEEKYQTYRAKEVLLSEEDKKRMQDEIMTLEKAAKEYQNEKFGYEGELFKQREEKMKPVQDKLYKAVQEVAASRRFDVVFDRSGSSQLFYAAAQFDITNDVLKKLGIDPNANN